jgi:hypothetical protein
VPFVTDRRGRRLRLVLAALAVLVLGSGAVAYVVTGDDAPPAARVAPSTGPSGRLAMSAVELNDMWTRYGDSPGFHWTGGDRTVSVDLPGDQVGWLFSDTFLGSVGADNTRPANQAMVHNSLVVQTRKQLTSTLHGGSPAVPLSLMCDDRVGLGCWVGDAVVDGDHLRVVVNHYAKTGPGVLDVQRTSTSLVSLALPHLTVAGTKPLPLTRGIAWGQSIVDDGGFSYVYGSERTDDFQFAHLARAPAGKLDGPWEFWDGTTWSPEEARSARLASGVGTSFSVDRIGDQWVLISMESHLPLNSSVVAYTATALTGPFTDPVELFRVPETDDQRPVIVYDATLHPHLAHPGKLLFSYNVNSLEQADLYTDARLYRPRFVEVPWPPAARDQATLPEPPTTLAARPDEDGRVQLSWAAAGQGAQYRVYQKDLTAGQLQWVRLPREVSEPSMLVDLLKNGHRYEYRVAAATGAGEGRHSAPVQATATVAPPDAPGDFVANAEGSGEIWLEWTAPRRAWRYVLEKRDLTAREGQFTRIDLPKAAATKRIVGGLVQGHEYEFRVRAVGGGGAGQWARARAIAWKGLPQPPGNVAATAGPGGTATVTWTAPPGTVTYKVYQRDVTAGQAEFTETRATVVGTNATATGLAPGHEYEFVVTATNRAGESGRSLPGRVTIPA